MYIAPQSNEPSPGCLLVWSTAVSPIGAALASGGILDILDVAAYPTPLYAVMVVLGILAQGFVLASYASGRPLLLTRAFATGLFTGIAGWFAVYYLPLLPLLAMACFLGIGILGLAPYWATLAGVVTIVDLVRQAAKVGMAAPAVALFVAGLAMAPAAFLGVEASQSYWNGSYRTALQGDEAAFQKLLHDDAHLEIAAQIRQRADQARPHKSWHPRPEEFLFRVVNIDAEELRELYFLLTGDRFEGIRAPLTLSKSELDIASDVRANLCYLDWQMTFRNDGPRQEEARAMLLVPEGTVPCDLTLWVNGVEQRAAFASTESTTAAYESVVRRKLDPALLTDEGSGRISLRVFPIPARSTAKVRVGFTVPFVDAQDRRWRGLPVFLARNFMVPHGHSVRIDEATPRTIRALHEDFRGSRVVGRPLAAGWARDREGSVIVQRLELEKQPERSRGPLLLVLEASAPFRPQRFNAKALEATLRRLDIETHVLMVGPKNSEHRVFLSGEPGLAKFVAAQDFAGGVNSPEGLRRALRIADEIEPSHAIWIAGPLPIATDSFTAVLRMFENGTNHDWHVIPCAPHNRLVARLLDSEAIHAVAPAGQVAGSVNAILCPAPRRSWTQVEAPPPNTPKITDHIIRLWAAESANTKAASSIVDAATLAAKYRIVTPWTGAVVLETAAQYREHDLDPNAESAIDQPVPGEPVPEPETWLMLGIGLLVLLLYRRFR